MSLVVFYPMLVEFPKPTGNIHSGFLQSDDYFDNMKWNSLLVLVGWKGEIRYQQEIEHSLVINYNFSCGKLQNN